MAKNKMKAELLGKASLAIANSLNDSEIRGLVAVYGYSPEKLAEGRALLDAAQAAFNAHAVAAGQQSQATQTLERAEVAARDAYQALAKIARATCDKPSLVILGLGGRAPQGSGGFLSAACTLFDNAARVPTLAGFGYDAARLAEGRALVTALQNADQQQEAAKGFAQAQQSALKALEAWTAQYIKIAKVALRQKPQLLEKLGVVARA